MELIQRSEFVREPCPGTCSARLQADICLNPTCPPKGGRYKKVAKRSSHSNSSVGAICVLHPPALIHPGHESRKLLALAPNQTEKFRGAKRVHVSAEKRFQPPADVRAGPGAQAISLRG